MDWSNIGMAAASVITTVLSLYHLFSKKFEKISDEFKEVRKEISHLENKVSNIEGQMIQMTRPIYKINPRYEEEPKEN